MRRMWRFLWSHKAEAVEIAGYAAAVVGVALVYVPAAVILGGVCAIWIAQGIEVNK